MKAIVTLLLIPAFLSANIKQAKGQVQSEIKHGLDSVFVEVYYTADLTDIADTASGDPLEKNAVTYRIYIDMKEGYKLQMVYGLDKHPLEIKSTRKFHNQQYAGRVLGSSISAPILKRNVMALDSWITIGYASNEHFGVPKSLDYDGSILGGSKNDGGSHQVKSGLLNNMNPEAGIPITKADGLIKPDSIEVKDPVFFQLNRNLLKVFDERDNNGQFILHDAVWAVLEGVEGPTPENQVLIAQITTAGELSFKLNFQLIAPYRGTERFFAENPDEIDFSHPSLIQSIERKHPH